MHITNTVNATKAVHGEAPCRCLQGRPGTQKVTVAYARRLSSIRRCRTQMRCQAAERRFDLVTTDVDGTLLNSKNELSARNEEAIAECTKLGIPVGPCMLTVLTIVSNVDCCNICAQVPTVCRFVLPLGKQGGHGARRFCQKWESPCQEYTCRVCLYTIQMAASCMRKILQSIFAMKSLLWQRS